MEKNYPSPKSGAVAGRSYHKSEVRGGGREELPHKVLLFLNICKTIFSINTAKTKGNRHFNLHYNFTVNKVEPARINEKTKTFQ